MLRSLAVVVLAVSAGVTFAQEKVLMPGAKAPSMIVSKWVKGAKVEKFEKDQVYVVEFWATWCGPCRDSIPHLSKLQKEWGKKVKFTGVSVWENGDNIPGQVQSFVDKMGDKMDYTVAIDQYTDPTDQTSGVMAATWMEAAKQDGIPAAFILKGDVVQWIGHPMNISEPLKQVVEGKFDLDRSKAEFQEFLNKKAEQEKLQARIAAVQTAYSNGRPEIAGKEIDELAAMGEDVLMNLAVASMQEARNEQGNKDYGLFLAEKLLAKSDHPVVAYYCAFAYEAKGNYSTAVLVLEKALKDFLAGPLVKEEGMKGFDEALKKRIEEDKKKIKVWICG